MDDLPVRQRIEMIGAHPILEDTHTFPNRVWYKRREAQQVGQQQRQNDKDRSFAWRPDFTATIPAVTSDGTVVHAAGHTVYGDVTRRQSDMTKLYNKRSAYSAVPIMAEDGNLRRRRLQPTAAQQRDKLNKVIKQLERADEKERANNIEVEAEATHASTLRRGKLMALAWGAYNEPSQQQLQLIKELAMVAAQLIQNGRQEHSQDLQLQRGFYEMFRASITAAATRATANQIAMKLRIADRQQAKHAASICVTTQGGRNGVDPAMLKAATDRARSFGYVGAFMNHGLGGADINLLRRKADDAAWLQHMTPQHLTHPIRSAEYTAAHTVVSHLPQAYTPGSEASSDYGDDAEDTEDDNEEGTVQSDDPAAGARNRLLRPLARAHDRSAARG